jgi:hypothetical protein
VVSLPVIVGIVAINLDGGRLMQERRNAQAAADAAALAAAAKLYAGYWSCYGQDSQGAAASAAAASAAANGYPASGVTVNIPPSSGSFAGKPGYVEVIIQTTLAASFGAAITSNDLPVQARAVARGLPMSLGIIVLQSTGANALLNESLAFTVVNSPVIVNSTDASAWTQASVGVVVASRFDITGNFVNAGPALMLGGVSTGVSPTPDPLAFLPVPDSSVAMVSAAPLVVNSALPTILQPGVYQGGVRITGLSTVLMQPGVYIMQGGGFTVDGGATVVGLGVMIYNTTSTTYAPGAISITALAKVVLAAPTSGAYQGINIFQDRSLAQPISLTGFGLAAITGVIYAPQAPVNLTGSATVGVDILGGAYVVRSMTVQGVGAININLNLNPPRIPDVRVVE